LHHSFCCVIILIALPSCEKSEGPAGKPGAPITTPPTEFTAPDASSADPTPEQTSTAQQKLEAKFYYTGENVAIANALLEELPPATRQSILENVRDGRKVEAVKLIRNFRKTSLAVSKLAVEMLAISEGVDPGIQ